MSKSGFVLCLLLSTLLFCACPPPLPSIEGEVKAVRSGDTLTVDYDLNLRETCWPVDSLYLGIVVPTDTVPNDSLIYVRDSVEYRTETGYHIPVLVSTRLQGSLKYTLPDSTMPTMYSLSFGHRKRHGGRSFPSLFPFRSQDSDGLMLGLGVAYFDRAVYPANVRPIGMTAGMHLELGWLHFRKHSTTFFSVKAEGYGLDEPARSMAFYQLGRLGLRYHPWGRSKPLISPILTLQYDKFNVTYNDDQKLRLDDFGFGIGAQLDNGWERLTYTYNTPLNSYHRIDFFSPFVSGLIGKAGTRYSIFHGDDVRLVEIAVYMELPGSRPRELRKADRRNVLRKAISYGWLAPLYLLGQLL